MDPRVGVQRFVLDYLGEIGSEVHEDGGIFTVEFPTGFRRRYGRQRLLTFDPEKRKEHVELVEAGSPFLKMLLTDAKAWGALSVYPTDALPEGSLVYTFQLEAYSSARKRVRFVWAALERGHNAPVVHEGVPPFFDACARDSARQADKDLLKSGITTILPAVESVGRSFSADAVKDAHEAFGKSMERVQDYFKGLHQDTHLEEARIRKRLGEIQSKLYFTEDGLRELKLQKEQERLTRDLHDLKKKNTSAQETIAADREKHAEQLRRRHEPKLRIRLLAATIIRPPSPPRPPPPTAEPAVPRASEAPPPEPSPAPDTAPAPPPA